MTPIFFSPKKPLTISFKTGIMSPMRVATIRQRLEKILFVVLFMLMAVFAYGQQNANPSKYALVIGNGNYTNTTKLNNPVNDANDMAAALQGLGFTVDRVLNGTQDQMVNAVMQLKRRLGASRNSYGFLFYAGHGVQSGGENFLIPVDANIPSENFLRNRTVSLQEMLGELNDAGNELNVVVLDACRDNPFSWARSGSRGLTVVANQPADSIIVFATSAGSTAADGTGRNGLFTVQLLKNLKTPGLEVSEVFRLTGSDVARASNRQQIPAIYNQFFETAYLGSRPVAAAPVQPMPTPAPAATTPMNPQPVPAQPPKLKVLESPPKFDDRKIENDLVYPPVALASGIEGRVILELFVDSTGLVQQVNILLEDPPNRGFGEAARRAFIGRRGTPAYNENGEPVLSRYRYPVSFRIR